jgi:metal-responsive CopG/Arc/MetJ family transcriptional regulator
MSENTERVTFRLTPEQADALDEIMVKFNLKTRSQVIRAAIENLIEDTAEEWNTRKLIIHIPKNNVIRLDNLVEDGLENTRETAVNKALDAYLDKKERYYTEAFEVYQQKRKAFKNAIEQNPSVTKS